MSRTKVSVVSYLNSKPFAFGLKHSDIYNEIEVSFDNPAVCAEKLINGQVEIGLIPVAMIPQVENAEIISEYCIAAEGKVDSVLLLSHKPLDEIQNVILDSESRTSVQLARLLAERYWHINPVWLENVKGIFPEIQKVEADAMV